jgi:hypothetical protein
MLGIVKKDLLPSMLTMTVVLPGMALYFINKTDVFYENIPFFAGNMSMLLLLNALVHIEIPEDRFKGYAFLDTLPATAREVVAGKFMVVLFLALLLLVYSFVLFSFFEGDPVEHLLGRAYVLATIAIGLFSAGLMYIAIFRFGCTTIIKVLIYGFPVLFVVVPIILVETNLEAIRSIDVPQLLRWVTTPNLLIFCAISLGVYFGLMLIAVRVKQYWRAGQE